MIVSHYDKLNFDFFVAIQHRCVYHSKRHMNSHYHLVIMNAKI